MFWLVLLGLFVYLASKFAPPYVTNNQFLDAMDSVARDAAAGNYNDDKVHLLLLKKAKDLDLPVKDDDIHIKRTGGEVIIEVDYTIVIELPLVNDYKWSFSPRVAKPILT